MKVGRQSPDGQPLQKMKFFKYGIVGTCGALTDFIVMHVLISTFGMVAVGANVAGFTAAVLQNFILNRRFTFPESRNQAASGQISKFLLVSLVGLALNLPVFMLVNLSLRSYLPTILMDSDMAFTWSHRLAKLCAIGVVLLWNYFVNYFWTFKQETPVGPAMKLVGSVEKRVQHGKGES